MGTVAEKVNKCLEIPVQKNSISSVAQFCDSDWLAQRETIRADAKSMQTSFSDLPIDFHRKIDISKTWKSYNILFETISFIWNY